MFGVNEQGADVLSLQFRPNLKKFTGKALIDKPGCPLDLAIGTSVEYDRLIHHFFSDLAFEALEQMVQKGEVKIPDPILQEALIFERKAALRRLEEVVQLNQSIRQVLQERFGVSPAPEAYDPFLSWSRQEEEKRVAAMIQEGHPFVVRRAIRLAYLQGKLDFSLSALEVKIRDLATRKAEQLVSQRVEAESTRASMNAILSRNNF